jgi:hypothetical protein
VRRFLSGLKAAEVGRKTLKGKGLAKRYLVFKELLFTAFAGAIMNEFEMRRKVRCHTETVDFFWERAGSQPRLCWEGWARIPGSLDEYLGNPQILSRFPSRAMRDMMGAI